MNSPQILTPQIYLYIKYINTNLKVFILNLTKIFIGLEETYFFNQNLNAN